MEIEVDIEQAYRLFFHEYPDVLDIKQLSEILGICEKTALKLLSKQKIRSIKVGRLYRIPKQYLMQYLGLAQNAKITLPDK